MTSKAALGYVLLTGKVVNISNIHSLTGYTNASREVGRCIEREKDFGFGLIVDRKKMEGRNRYGVYSTWVNYKMNWATNNLNHLKNLAKYIAKEIGEPKTTYQKEMLNKLKPLLK